MELREIKGYVFANESKHDNYGFTHLSHMFKNGHEIATGRQRWVNRTWERYRYQTSMMNAVYNLIEDRRIELTRDFMREHRYGRLTEKRREELESFLETDEELTHWKVVLFELK